MIKNTLLCCFSIAMSHLLCAQTKADSSLSLSAKERSVVTISAFTAQGNMPKLQTALRDGLNVGLTVSEIKEMLVQLYAYAGFPRSLNALDKLMKVLEERKRNGIIDEAGIEPLPYPVGKTMLQTGTANQTKLTGRKIGGGVYEFAPVIDLFLKEHLFGAIFGRNNLDWKTREIVTISALAALGGVDNQLRSHFGVGMYNGLTATQLHELISIIHTNVGSTEGEAANLILQSVVGSTGIRNETIPGKQDKVENTLFPKGEKITNNNFVGYAWLQQLITADSSNSIQVGSVTFDPGARTNWHYHPAGQILLVIDGAGYYQEKGGPKKILRKGDVVKCPPNVQHWHGASKEEKFIQVAITNTEKGAVVWLEKVSDQEYHFPEKSDNRN